MPTPNLQNSGPRVFISYTHDSPEHAHRVLSLANQLRSEGVDCHLDQYEQSPPEGWPNWMRYQIRDAQYVLVVCTEPYYRRAEGLEERGRGLGAVWESGLVTTEAYNSQGRNDKFIPVVFSPGEVRYIPDFLQTTTRYDLSPLGDYDKLYARLTGQRIVERPPLGQVRPVGSRVPPDSPINQAEVDDMSRVLHVSQKSLVLIGTEEEMMFVRAERVQESNGELSLEIMPMSGQESAFIAGLAQERGRKKFVVAFSNSAAQARAESVTRTHTGAGERLSVDARISENQGGFGMEMGTTGHSADDIAELRVRRILLNEKPPADVARWVKPDAVFDMLVAGTQGVLTVKASPLPDLYRQIGANGPYFLEAARLMAVLFLKLSNSVEHVLRLDLSFVSPTILRVDFHGRRRKAYSNAPAHEIKVAGICTLSESE